MSDKVQIDPDLLYPGDVIRFDYLIQGGNETLTGLAIKRVKDAIASDDRLDYQGSEMSNPVDLETGQNAEILSIYASVRRYRRSDRPELQKASIASVAVAAVLGIVTGAVIAYSTLHFKSYAIARVVQSDASDEVKQAAIDAIAEEKTIGAGLAGVGGGLAVLGIVVLLIWGASK